MKALVRWEQRSVSRNVATQQQGASVTPGRRYSPERAPTERRTRSGEHRCTIRTGTLGACSALLFGFAAGEARALDSDVGVGLGAGYVQAREDLLSPLVFRGPGGLVTASFAGRSEHSELETRFYAGLALLVDRYDTNNAAVAAGINSRWRWDLRHGTHAAVRLGPMLDVHSWIAQYDAWDDSHAYWLGVISAGPSMQLLAHAPAERDWVLDLEFPVIAFVSRPPLHRLNKADDLVDGRYWLSRVATKARLTSVHELQAVRVRATWRGRGAKIRVDPWAAFELDRFSDPRSVTTLGLWLGAEARWGS